MSGAFRYQVNHRWRSATLANVASARFLWEWLQFVNSHTGMSVIEVGTGTTSHGAAIPASWLSWDGTVDPTTLTPSMDSNSWIVFEAINADPLLNGGGTTPWQAKIQMTLSAGYSDPSGTDYGMNGVTGQCVLRASATGGWVGSPTWDFAPVYGEGSDDIKLLGIGTTPYLNRDYFLDIVGDDDTIWWRGSIGDVSREPKSMSRGGYIGMIERYYSMIDYPFIAFANPLNDNSRGLNYDRGAFSRVFSVNYYAYSVFDSHNAGLNAYSYSLSYDGTKMTFHVADNWRDYMIRKIWKYHYSDGKLIMLPTLIRHYQAPDYYDIFGFLRGYRHVPSLIGTSTLLGQNLEYIQICVQDDILYGGVVMPWEPGVVPIW